MTLKIRTQFVANSSSSSFVLVGVALPKDLLDFESLIGFDGGDIYDATNKFLKRTGLYVVNNVEDGCPDNNTIMIGKMIRSNMEEYCSLKTHDLSVIEEAKSILLDLGITSPIKIITGSRSC